MMRQVTLGGDYGARIAGAIDDLQARYDAAWAIGSPAQRAAAEALLAQIGTVDWQVEGYASPEAQRDLSIKFHWGHDHRFDDTLAVTGRMGRRHLSLAAEFTEAFGLAPDHFRGKDILDVGCWTGGTTLTLKMLGAARVVALEEVRKYAAATQRLARGVYGLTDVDCHPVSLYRFTEGSFDHVYCPGVIYHLSDPVLALRRLFNRLRDGGDILLEGEGLDDPAPVCRFAGSREHHAAGSPDELNRGGWNWFLPSPACLGRWMLEAGFDDVAVFHSPVSRRVFGHGRRRAWRDITRAGLSVPDVP